MTEPTFKQIIKARNQCANIIALYGEQYLPIFERLENEIALRKEKQALLEKAININSKNDTQNGTQNDTQNDTQLSRSFNAKTK